MPPLPKTNCWTNGHKEMLNVTIEPMIRKMNKAIILGDFNCREVNWETLECEGNENTQGNGILKMTVTPKGQARG